MQDMRCITCKDARGKSQNYDGLYVGFMCDSCFEAWKTVNLINTESSKSIKANAKIPVKSPLPSVAATLPTMTNGSPGIAAVDSKGDPRKNPLDTEKVKIERPESEDQEQKEKCDLFLTQSSPAPIITKSLNNMYTITVEHPLIRPGLKITTEASERYVVEVVKKLMNIIRELNK